AETIGSLTMDGGQIATDTGTLTLNGDVTRVASAASQSSIFGILSLGGATRTFTIGTNPSAGMTISAAITDGSGTGGLIKAGAGLFSLGNSNTFTVPTFVSDGTLLISVSFALVRVVGGAVLSNGAMLRLV